MALPRVSYTRRRHETLRKLGIEQLPALRMVDAPEQTDELFSGDLPVRMPVGAKVQIFWCQS
jgi:hypothetical protein